MNKKRKIICTIILCGIGLICLLIFADYEGYFSCNEYSKEDIISEAIHIQYRGASEKKLEKIFTSQYIEEINVSPDFYKKKIFYTIQDDYVDSIKELSENQYKASVSVEDLGGSYLEIITLIKDSNGKYLISNIEFDI